MRSAPGAGEAARASGAAQARRPRATGPEIPRAQLPIPTQTSFPSPNASFLGSPAGPTRPAGSRGSACAPSTHPRNAGNGSAFPTAARSSDGYQPTLRIWLELPSPAAVGTHGGGYSGHLVPPSCARPAGPAARPRRSGAAPDPTTRCRCQTPRATPGPGGAPTDSPPGLPSSGKVERLPPGRAPAPPSSQAESAAGEARCLDASPRQQRRLPRHRTAPFSCPVSGCRLTDRRSGHIGRPLPSVHL
ncbi:unnamed protein product [Coccothraustes coccothraustes]